MDRLKLSAREEVIRKAFVYFICEVQKKSPKTAKHYYESMERYLPRFIEEKMSFYVHSIYDITDVKILQDIHDNILNKPEWKYINSHSHGSTFTLGLRSYIALLKSEHYPFPDKVIPENDIVENALNLVYTEGKTYSICSNHFERNQDARKKCIEHYGCKCAVCGFDFEKKYGEFGKGYIEVHHIVPLSKIKKTYEVDPVRDLIPLCANCHSIIHRFEPALQPDKLTEIIFNNS